MKVAATVAILLLALTGTSKAQSYEDVRKTQLGKLGGFMFFKDCGIASANDLTLANIEALAAMDKAAKAEGRTVKSDDYLDADIAVERDKAAQAAAKPVNCISIFKHPKLLASIYASLDKLHDAALRSAQHPAD